MAVLMTVPTVAPTVAAMVAPTVARRVRPTPVPVAASRV
jgi:hypothetical protein